MTDNLHYWRTCYDCGDLLVYDKAEVDLVIQQQTVQLAEKDAQIAALQKSREPRPGELDKEMLSQHNAALFEGLQEVQVERDDAEAKLSALQHRIRDKATELRSGDHSSAEGVRFAFNCASVLESLL